MEGGEGKPSQGLMHASLGGITPPTSSWARVPGDSPAPGNPNLARLKGTVGSGGLRCGVQGPQPLCCPPGPERVQEPGVRAEVPFPCTLPMQARRQTLGRSEADGPSRAHAHALTCTHSNTRMPVCTRMVGLRGQGSRAVLCPGFRDPAGPEPRPRVSLPGCLSPPQRPQAFCRLPAGTPLPTRPWPPGPANLL